MSSAGTRVAAVGRLRGASRGRDRLRGASRGRLGGASCGSRSRAGTTRATSGASEQRGAGDLVRLAAVVGLAAAAVDVDEDTRVGGRVGTGEADGVGRRGTAVAGDVDLGAANVKLRAGLRAGIVQRNELGTHEVLARSDTGRHVEVGPAVVGDQVIDGPFAVAEAGFGDLEPLEPGGAGGGGVVDLGEVDDDGAWKKDTLADRPKPYAKKNMGGNSPL